MADERAAAVAGAFGGEAQAPMELASNVLPVRT